MREIPRQPLRWRTPGARQRPGHSPPPAPERTTTAPEPSRPGDLRKGESSTRTSARPVGRTSYLEAPEWGRVRRMAAAHFGRHVADLLPTDGEYVSTATNILRAHGENKAASWLEGHEIADAGPFPLTRGDTRGEWE